MAESARTFYGFGNRAEDERYDWLGKRLDFDSARHYWPVGSRRPADPKIQRFHRHVIRWAEVRTTTRRNGGKFFVEICCIHAHIMYDRSPVVNKEERLAQILGLVRGGKAHTQAQLLRSLRSRGERVDQSTLSRDLAELGIRKAGGRYVLPARAEDSKPPALADFAGAVKRFTACGPHLTVLTTVVGQAQAVAVAIDSAADLAIVATLAGDDTVFVATRNRRTQAVALRRLKQWFGDKHEL